MLRTVLRRLLPLRARRKLPALLIRLFPDQKAALDAAYAGSLARIADGSGKAGGIAVGEKVALKILALRAADGADAPSTYRPVTTPGVYVVTTLPEGSQWGAVTPWVMERGSQFRPAPPPPLASHETRAARLCPNGTGQIDRRGRRSYQDAFEEFARKITGFAEDFQSGSALRCAAYKMTIRWIVRSADHGGALPNAGSAL